MMTSRQASHTDDTELHYLRRSFVRHLAADRRSTATRAAYTTAIAQLEAFLAAQGFPTTVGELRHDHVDAFFVSLHERQLRPSTILARHHALSRFFGWLVVVPTYIVDRLRALVLGLGLSKLHTEGGLSCSIVAPS